MLRRTLIFGAPLVAGTRPPGRSEAAFLLRFNLRESQEQVRRLLGPPAQVSDFGEALISWQYHIDQHDHHDFSHTLCFRKSEGTLISITRNTEEPERVDHLFPVRETATQKHEASQWSVRVRRMAGSRLLVAAGVSEPGQPTTQLMYLRESEAKIFLPWLSV